MRQGRAPISAPRVSLLSVLAVTGVLIWTALSTTFGPGTSSDAPAPAAARPDEPDLAAAVPVEHGLPPDLPLKGRSTQPADTAPATLFVVLDGTAAIDAFESARRSGRSRSAARSQALDARRQTEESADEVLAALRRAGADPQELYRTANAIPGLALMVDRVAARELPRLPQVRSVRRMIPKEPTNSTAVQLTRTARSWQQTGRLGAGVRIGIVDTGIDYTHATFGGPGTPQAYDAIDPTKVTPSTFPTAKVVGGYDFAGDAYDAGGEPGSGARRPAPDPNPLGCGKHGTHVAATAAGFGVTGAGDTFRGSYRELSPEQLDRMRIGPGTAPKAKLYALKVFGCEGSTVLTPLALDWALDPNGDGNFSDRLDVVNLSLGSAYGAPDDPLNLFIRALARHGVVPVAAAGNGGDLYDVGGSPGSAPQALTVASVHDSYVLRDGAEVVAPGGGTRLEAGQYSVNYPDYDSLDRTAPVVVLSEGGNADGCDPYSRSDTAAVAGTFVWLEWDDDPATRRCGSQQRADNATAAGAAGVLLTSQRPQFPAKIAGNEQIPVFQFTATATRALRSAAEAGTLRIQLAGSLRLSVPTYDQAITDTESAFTSRGVRAPAVKPDVAAPGDTITSASAGTGDGRLVLSGTSMASPHVAGIVALLRKAHPQWSVEELKAAVMNTAGADVYDSASRRRLVHAPNRVGAGRVDALAALRTRVVAMAAGQAHHGHVSVSFGVLEIDGPTTRSRMIEVRNKGSEPVTFAASYQPITTIPGVDYRLGADRIRIEPGESDRLRLSIRIEDPGQLRKTADPTIEKTQLGLARQFLADASGRVVLTPVSRRRSRSMSPNPVALRVPVYAAPKPVADIAAAVQVRGPRNGLVLGLTGRGLDQGSGDAAYRSLITVLQLATRSPRLPPCSGAVLVNCTPNETAEGGDLRYVGVTSTAPMASAGGVPAVLGFGISTWGNWSSLGGNTLPFVRIDTTGDGAADFQTSVIKPAGTDVLLATTVDLTRPGLPVVGALPVNGQPGDVDTNVFDSNVVVLPVALSALGIDPTGKSAPITFTAGVAGYYTGPADTDGVIDSTDPVRFDPLRPGLWVQGGGRPALSFHAMPGTVLEISPGPGGGRRSNELLVLHHHNRSGDRTQVVTLPTTGGG